MASIRLKGPKIGLFFNHKLNKINNLDCMAEREGFEPPIALRLCLISSQVHSTGLCHLSTLYPLPPTTSPPTPGGARPVLSSLLAKDNRGNAPLHLASNGPLRHPAKPHAPCPRCFSQHNSASDPESNLASASGTLPQVTFPELPPLSPTPFYFAPSNPPP